jgi:hypothetical protein
VTAVLPAAARTAPRRPLPAGAPTGSTGWRTSPRAFADSEAGTTVKSTLRIGSEAQEPASPTFESDRIAETDQAFPDDLGVHAEGNAEGWRPATDHRITPLRSRRTKCAVPPGR